MASTRKCRIAITDAEGVVHSIEVNGTSLFEVAAAGIAQMREAGFVGALSPNAVVRVEVQLAPVIHEVPVRTLQRWANGPSISPKQEVLKRPIRTSVRQAPSSGRLPVQAGTATDSQRKRRTSAADTSTACHPKDMLIGACRGWCVALPGCSPYATLARDTDMPWNPATLKRLRERRGLTQQKLAERAGAHRVTIVKLESGALRPGVDLLESLARALRVQVADLLKQVPDEVTG